MKDSIREALQREYGEWQKLGQGELTWNLPVVPEPYFYPFFGHGALVPQPGLIDDGRRETPFSRLADSLMRPFRPSPPPAAGRSECPDFLLPLASGDPPDFLADARAELTHWSWLLPADIQWEPKEWEPLLYSLSAARFPVCMEILATGGRIRFRWVVEASDAEVLEDSAVAVGTAVQPEEDALLHWMDTREGSLWSRELALRREFLFPIRDDFRADPYEGILASVSRLGPGELAVVQMLFSPCENAWAQGIWRSLTADDGRPFFSDGQPHLQAARSKCSRPLFAASVRLAMLSEDGNAEAKAERLRRSFGCFDGANGLVEGKRSPEEEDNDVADLLARSFRRSGMILNSSELFSLVHPPSGGTGAPALARQETRTRQVPIRHAGATGLLLGTNEHAGHTVGCRLRQEERARHMHVIGASGTGKSTFLLRCMLQDLESGSGLALLDPHGDLVEALLDRLPRDRVKDVVLFDPADTEFPVGFNILRAHTDIEKDLLASDFVAIFERLSSSWGDQMSAVLGNAALALLESERGGTLIDLKRFLIEKGFREDFLRGVTDPEVVYFWRHEFPLLRGTTQGSLLTRLSGFLRHRMIRNMVSQKGERFDVARMMDEGKVILAPLSQGLIGQENSWLLGSLLVSRFYQAALSRQSQGEADRRPFYLYLDEAHNFVTPSIASILSGTRKYGLGLVLAHQELDQFPSRESGILSSVLTNCHTRVCFRLGDHDATRLESGFGHFEAGDLRRLGVGEAICRIGGSEEDFNIRTSPAPDPPADSRATRESAVSHSRSQYATPRGQVEEASARGAPEPPPPKAGGTRRADRPTTTLPTEAPPLPVTESPPAEKPEQPVPDAVQPETVPAAQTPPPLPVPEVPRTPGRGGSQHKHLQRVIKAHGNGLGLRATIEAELPDRAGCIDVLLENGGTRIAFEIAEKSPVGQELRNIRKCVEAGIAEIYVVSADPAHLAKVSATADAEIGPELLAGVTFAPASELGEIFAGIGARLAATETTTRGFRVKVTYNPAKGDVRETRNREIHRAVSDHLEGRKAED